RSILMNKHTPLPNQCETRDNRTVGPDFNAICAPDAKKDREANVADYHGVHAFWLRHAGDALSTAPPGCLRCTSFTTDWGFRLTVRYSRPRYSPTMPRIKSWTPESRRTAAISDAQPGGGDRRSASPTTIAPRTAPSTLGVQ